MTQWKNRAVYGYGYWPVEEKEIFVDNVSVWLSPLTKEKQASIHIDLLDNKISSEQANVLINQFLSHISWVSHQPMRLGFGYDSPAKQDNFKREQDMSFERLICGFPDIFELYKDKEILKALAFYREGKIAEHYNLAFACLSYYKILERKKMQENAVKLDDWMKQIMPRIESQNDLNFKNLNQLLCEYNQKYAFSMSLSEFFFKEIRGRAAHYFESGSESPDDLDYLNLFGNATSPLADMADIYILEELKVDDHIFSISYAMNSQMGFQWQEARKNGCRSATA